VRRLPSRNCISTSDAEYDGDDGVPLAVRYESVASRSDSKPPRTADSKSRVRTARSSAILRFCSSGERLFTCCGWLVLPFFLFFDEAVMVGCSACGRGQLILYLVVILGAGCRLMRVQATFREVVRRLILGPADGQTPCRHSERAGRHQKTNPSVKIKFAPLPCVFAFLRFQTKAPQNDYIPNEG